jgi:hypothetical protein
MGRRLIYHPALREKRQEFLECRIRRAAGVGGNPLGSIGADVFFSRIIEKFADGLRDLGGIANAQQRAGRLETCEGFRKIEARRAGEERRMQARRLEGVMPAQLDKRAADENDVGEPIEKSEFAERVGEINIGRRCYRVARRAPRHAEAASGESGRNGLTACRVARHDEGQEARIRCNEPDMDIRCDLVFALMRVGCKPDRPLCHGCAKAAKFSLICSEWRGIVLDVARRRYDRCAEHAQPFSACAILRHDGGEAAENIADRRRIAPPTLEGALGDTRVNEGERRAALLRRDDQIWPKLGFDPHPEVRPPVIEKARTKIGVVERYELMESAARQAFGHEVGRGDCAGGDENVEPRAARKQTIDERQHRERFTDARCMNPDEGP